MSAPVSSLAEASAGIAGGTLSPVALTEAALARIAALDPKLNAFITITADRARQAAAAAEVGRGAKKATATSEGAAAKRVTSNGAAAKRATATTKREPKVLVCNCPARTRSRGGHGSWQSK